MTMQVGPNSKGDIVKHRLRTSRPSAATVVAGAALFTALGGTGLAATGSLVNIADGTDAARIAHVNAHGGLQVAGTVTAQLATPANYLHSGLLNLTSASGCVHLTTAPMGEAIIVRQVRFDIFANPSPGVGQTVHIYEDPNCLTLVADVNPSGLGEVIVPFDPGLGIPAGSSLSTDATGSVKAEAYMDGYLVPSAQVPAVANRKIANSGHRQKVG
jgi:hypothetical protein